MRCRNQFNKEAETRIWFMGNRKGEIQRNKKMNMVYGEQTVEVQRKYENLNVVHKSKENG
jgi:competence transcription factor ComK